MQHDNDEYKNWEGGGGGGKWSKNRERRANMDSIQLAHVKVQWRISVTVVTFRGFVPS
jgi:hypothetical protein